jgi:2-deoxy-D-gluconate 3-dehydrogenase
MTFPLFDLTGRRALITGSSQGIGLALAEGLAAHGASIVLNGRDAGRLDAAAERLAGLGHDVSRAPFDVTDPEAAAAGVAAALVDGPLDILVNNAGVIRRADSVDFTEKDWDEVIDVNLKAVFFLSQAFARAAFARSAGGAIVNIASLLSFQGGIRIPSYTAAKHGVAGLTKLLANEWAARGINVNAIAPGYIETNNTEALRADEARNRAILDRIPAGRWGEASDIAGAAVFLASPAARYIHGTILPVDGGWLAR